VHYPSTRIGDVFFLIMSMSSCDVFFDAPRSLPPSLFDEHAWRAKDGLTKNVYVRVRPESGCHIRLSDGTSTNEVPLGVPFFFESELFRGTAMLRLRDVPGSQDVDGDRAYFKGRKRKFRFVVTGEFKKPTRFSDIWTGQAWDRALLQLPPHWLVELGVSVFRRIARGLRADFSSEKPMALSLLASTMQTVHAHSAEESRQLLASDEAQRQLPWFVCPTADVPEHLPQLTERLGRTQVSPRKRKTTLMNPEGMSSDLYFQPGTVYSFDAYQGVFDAHKYVLDVGAGIVVDISKHLDEQCIEVMATNGNDEYAWCFEIWHKNVLTNKNA